MNSPSYYPATVRLPSLIEPLEARVAPAILVSPSVATFRDLDGDLVTVKLSKPLLTGANFSDVFSFLGGNYVDNDTPQSFLSLDLYELGTAANGLNVTVSVKPSPTGDGRVDIGFIDARHDNGGGNFTGIDLGTIKVPGDVGRLSAGDADTTTRALAALVADSYGVKNFGATGTINGDGGRFVTKGDFQGTLTVAGDLAMLKIGGSLRPAQQLAAGFNDRDGGTLTVNGNLNSAEIAGSILGSIDQFDGFLQVGGRLEALKIGGSIAGESGNFANANSGQVFVSGGIGKATVGGSLIGEASDGSGSISTNGDIQSITVRGSLIGGSGRFSGSIEAPNGKIGKVVIGGEVRGGLGLNTGDIEGGKGIGSVTIGGSLTGVGQFSGRIVATRSGANIGKVKIGGSLTNSLNAIDAGLIFTLGNIGGVSVGGNVEVFGNLHSLVIYAGGSIGPVSVGGDLSNASILAGVTVENPRRFGDGDTFSGTDASVIASITIKGSVYSNDTAAFEAKRIGKLKIGRVTYAHNNPALDFANGFDIVPDVNGRLLVKEF